MNQADHTSTNTRGCLCRAFDALKSLLYRLNEYVLVRSQRKGMQKRIKELREKARRAYHTDEF